MDRWQLPWPRIGQLVLLFITLTLATAADAQTDSIYEMGVKAYGSYHGGDIDVVSLNNLKLDLHSPLVSYPQRGKLHLGFTLRYSNPSAEIACSLKNPQTGDCEQYQWLWIPAKYGTGYAAGVQVIPDLAVGEAEQQYGTTTSKPLYSVVSADGSQHAITYLATAGETVDATGMWLNTNTNIIIDSAGVQYNYSSGTVTDPNGNEITKTTTGWIDSVGRAIASPPAINYLNGSVSGGTSTTDYTNCGGSLPTYAAAQWVIPGFDGNVTYKFCWAKFPVSVGTTHGDTNAYSGTAYMLQSLVLPNNTSWTFSYDGAANLSSATLPTGGTISYTSGMAGLGCGATQAYPQYYPFFTSSRTVNANDGTDAHSWSYSGNAYPKGSTTVTDPVNNQQLHGFTALAGCSYFETSEQDYNGTVSSGTLLKTITTGYSYSSGSYPTGPLFAYNVVPTSIKTTWPNSKVSEMDKTYDSGTSGVIYGKVVTESDYDYGTSSKGALLKKTSTSYMFQNNGSYQTANLLNLPYTITVTNGSGYNCAETIYGYDISTRLYSAGVSTQHVSAPNSVRGNLSSLTKEISTAPCQSGTSWTSSVTAYTNAYDTGEVYQSVDPLSNTTTYTYDPSFAGAFVTKTQLPDTNSPSLAHHIVQDWYDLNTGLKTSHTDENGNPTTYFYDSMGRVETITPPLPEGVIQFTYTDTPGSLAVQKTQKISSTLSTLEYELFDQLGRSVSHVIANGESTPYDKTDTCYEARGLKSFVSYPYQTSTWNVWPTCPSTAAGDSYGYDGMKRTTSLTHSDSTAVTYSYTGAAASVTDEGNGTRGLERVSQVDGLGRLISACEVTSTTLAVGADKTPISCAQDIAATGFLTTYNYDGLSNLLSVSQGSNLNPRNFSYDSLSRLITTTNPESGTTCFGTWSGSTCNEQYDADSNVLSRSRPAPNQSSATTYVTASYAYDPLNRLRTKTYSDGSTPTVTLNYDETTVNSNSLSNTTGRLSSEYTGPSTGVSSESIVSYAAPGWVATDIQCTPQNCANNKYFSLAYGYDGVGDVTSSGNGITFTYALTYNIAPRLTGISTNWFSPTIRSGNLISNLSYNAFGSPSSENVNNNVISESWIYDTRGRMQTDKATAGSGTVYNLYNLTYSGNSNVLTSTDSINGAWSNYTYDDFNRLTKSTCSTGCPQNTGSLTFTYAYDRYGNRWQQNVTAGNGPQPQYTYDANNRLTTAGFSFDAAGNIISDGNHSYTYDAENRIVKVDTGTTAVYVYDAEGRRVAKTAASAGGAFEYLFDLAGRVVTELGAGTSNVNRTEVFAGGRHVATQNVGLTTTYFMHTDWLGTERGRSDLSGTLVQSCTSFAYGDGMNCSGPYASPLHFTGKMRDAETGLDEFPARYYSSTQGRWYSPDWASAQVPVPYADLHNPQTLNLYDYVGGDPTNHADADGHFNFNPTAMRDADLQEQAQENADKADARQASAQNTLTLSSTQQTTTKNADGTTTTVTTSTLITFASGKNDAGTFLGADRVVNTRVTTADGSPANVAGGNDNTSVTHISQKDAINAVGSRAFTDAQQSATPSFGQQFRHQVGQDFVQHPLKQVGIVLGAASLPIGAISVPAGIAVGVGGAGAAVADDALHPAPYQ